jgi:hypothetical protein
MGIPASRDRVDGELRFSTRIPPRVKNPEIPHAAAVEQATYTS